MSNPKRLTPKDLVVGGRYLHANGLFIRQIDEIEGDAVFYHDQHSDGRCGKAAFLRACPQIAPPSNEAFPAVQLPTSASPREGEFTLRDEANALTAFAFRNGFLEDLHAGKHSPVLDQPGYSRITNDEMKRLMIEASAKLAQVLQMKQNDPAKYEYFIRNYRRMYCRAWKRE